MPDTLIALIRGINVGPTTTVAMAGLRETFEDLGYADVRTVLNSGNVIFTSDDPSAQVAARIEAALPERIGMHARVVVVTASELAGIIAGNPLITIAGDPSRMLFAVLADQVDPARLEPLLEQTWAPEALALGARVAYMWCPNGVTASRLNQAVGRILGDATTTRNWSTMTKIQAVTNS